MEDNNNIFRRYVTTGTSRSLLAVTLSQVEEILMSPSLPEMVYHIAKMLGLLLK